MNAPATIQTPHRVAADFTFEARELAFDEHYTLTQEFEQIAADYGEAEARRVLADYDYCEDAAEYFEHHRMHFLERAREEFAEVV